MGASLPPAPTRSFGTNTVLVSARSAAVQATVCQTSALGGFETAKEATRSEDADAAATHKSEQRLSERVDPNLEDRRSQQSLQQDPGFDQSEACAVSMESRTIRQGDEHESHDVAQL